MNANCYKTVFSKRLGILVAVGEHAASQGKATGSFAGAGFVKGFSHATVCYVGALTLSFALVSMVWAAPANNALPTGGQVAQGAAAISQSGANMAINQSTARAIVNWQSFDIGKDAKVNIVQPNSQSVLLTRVNGPAPSQIFGQMTANGQVVLVNPNGVTFGKDGSVSAAGLTASTLNTTDADFMAGRNRFTRDGATGQVLNQGALTAAPGGYVALLGASVSNEGKIVAPQGNVALGAAESITLPLYGSSRIKMELTPSALNAAVANQKSGSIVTEGGQVYMQAAAVGNAIASVMQSGSIDTTGAQGGAVHLLADGGRIRVDGSITANSTAAGNKGGDIVIGLDEVTGVLAKSTDVSGSQLESKGGFVETSGEFLKVDGIQIKAKEWLLDPSDITISSATNSNVTGASPADITPNGITGTSSIVSVGTIQTAINGGTNVTIKTMNASNTTGAGNITIANPLLFANNSNTDATLSLVADNGITQNAGATITTNAVAGKTGLVNVNMTALGNYQGSIAASTGSQGITLNAAINTNGDVTLNGTTNNSAAASVSNAIGVDIKSTAAITAKSISITGNSQSSFGIQSASALNATDKITLDGTSKNWVGVVNTGAVTAGGALKIDGHKTTAAGYQGININSAVKGASVAITGDSVGHYGVGIGTSGSVESTTGDVIIIGTGTGATAMGSSNNAVGVQVRGNLTAKGKLSITGTKVGSGGYQGVTFSDSKTMKGDSIDITGTSNVYDAITFTNATLTATKTLKITADSTAVGKGILFSGGSTNTFTADSYLVTAKTAVNNGIYFSGTNTFNSTSTTTDSLIDVTRTTAGGDTIFNAGTLTINSGSGKSTLQTSTTNVGGGIRINFGSTVNTTGDVTIGSKNTDNAYTFNQGTINAQGNLTLLGKINSGSGVLAGVWLQDSGGTGAKITGSTGANITIDGTNLGGGAGVNLSVNTSANSITTTGTALGGAVGNISITGTSASGHGISNAIAEVKNNSTNTSTGAKGNVTLTGTTLAGSGQGIYNVAAGTNAGLNAIYAKGDLTLIGKSVNGYSVNTSGTLEAGGLLKIEGTAIPTVPLLNATSIGIYVGNTVKGGTVSMTGTTGGSKGIEVNAAVTSTVGDISLTGTGGGNYYYGQGVVTGANGTLTSQLGGITIKGTATASGNNITTIGAQIQGLVTAATDILVEGKNTANTPNFGLSIENTIKSTAGNITVTAENTSGTTRALSLNATGKLQTDSNSKAININTNGMDLNTGALVQAGTAGTGTVNIKTIGNNNISVGGGDVGSNTSSFQTLGINNAELSQITTGNLFIGDTAKKGNITVTSAVTTNPTTGNVTLQTGGNIAINAALTVSNAVSPKNLTLNGAGNGTTPSSISQTAAITTAGLELLGANATHTLTNTGNDIKKLAGNTGTVSLTNNAAFGIDTVNTVGLTTSGNTTLNSTAAVTQNQAVSAAGLQLLGTGGSYTLNHADNTVQKLAGSTGSVSLTNKGDLEVSTVNTAGLTAAGNVSITTTAGSTTSNLGNLTLKKNITAANVDLNTAGSVFRDSASVTDGIIKASLLRIKAGAGVGISTSRIKTDVATLSMESAGDQYVTEANAVTVAAKSTGGSVNIDSAGALTVGSSTLIDATTINGISAEKGVVLTAQAGDLNINQAISNATSGDVVLGAGVGKLAGDGTGGDVKTGGVVTNSASGGNTYIYTGAVATTGTLTNSFSSNLGSLYLSTIGLNLANTASYKGYTGTPAPIAGGDTTQVFFREAIGLGTVDLGTSTVNKTYGDVSKTYVDGGSLTADVRSQMKSMNSSASLDTISRAVTGAASTVKIKTADLIDALSIAPNTAFSASSYSTSNNLKANTAGYGYSVTYTGSTYGVSLVNTSAKVVVDKKELTGVTIEGAGNTYGGTVAAGAVKFDASNKVGADNIGGTASVQSTAADLSSSNNLKYKASGYDQKVSALTSGNTNNDADNYTFDPVTTTGNYTVSKLALTGVTIEGAGNTYGGTVAAGAVKFDASNKVGADNIGGTASVQSTVADLSSSSNLKYKAGGYDQKVSALTSGNTNNDADNYTFDPVTNAGSYTVSKLALTGVTIEGAGKTYGDAVLAGAVNFGGSNLKSGDVVSGVASVQSAVSNLSTSNNLKVGSYDQKVAAISSGNANGDADNYTFRAVTATGNYNVGKKAMTITGLTVSDKTYNGDAGAAVVTTGLVKGGLVGTDVVTVSATGAFRNDTNSADDKNVKLLGGVVQAKTVALSSSYGGSDKDNYAITDQTTSNAKINKKDVNLDSITAAGKTYDGNNTASITGVTLKSTDLVGSETLGATATGTFDSKNAGSRTATVTAANTTLLDGVGANAGLALNYNVVGTKTTTATIAKKDVNLDSITAAGKTYDGNNTASITGVTLKSTDLVGSETLVASATGTFDSKNAGSRTATVTAANTLLANGTNGGLADNYKVVGTKTATATIAKANLTVTLSDQTKTYDGITAATLIPNAFTVKGVTVAGQTESATVTQTVALYNDKNVLGASSVTANLAAVNFAAATGTDLSNYILPTSVTGKGTITPKDAAVTGTATTVQANGTQQTQAAATKSGFVAGEDVTVSGVATGLIAGTYNSNLSAAPANAATVLSNYKITYTNAALRITPAVVTNSTVNVALARTTTPTSRLNLMGFSNAGGVGAAVAGAVDSGADSKEPAGATAMPPQVCTPESLQECECEESDTGDGIELCLAPGNRS